MISVLLLFAFLMSLIKDFTEKMIGHNEQDGQTDEVVEKATKNQNKYL